MEKRGQVTTFVVVGIVILIVLASVLPSGISWLRRRLAAGSR